MTPSVCRPLLAVFLALLVSAAASAQPMQWWKMEPAKTELGLTSDQSARIEGIFQESMGQLRQQKGELDRLEGKLSRLIEASADEGQVTQQIDRVEAVRSALNKTRTLMLLRMRQALTPGSAPQAECPARALGTRAARAKQATAVAVARWEQASGRSSEPSKLVVRLSGLEDSEMKPNGMKWADAPTQSAQPSCWRRPRTSRPRRSPRNAFPS